MMGCEDGITIYQPEKWYRDTMIEGILFDMDGLILDTEKLYTRFWMEAAESLGYPLTREQALGLRSLNGKAGAEKMQSYFDRPVDYDKIKQKRIERMDVFVEKEGVELKKGAEQLLTFARDNGMKTAIATSSPLERAQKYLHSVGVDHFFDRMISGYMVKNGKPEPDIYLLAAKELGLEPDACLALEDSPSGIMAAHRAGCYPVMIPDQDEPSAQTCSYLFAKARDLSCVITLFDWFTK